MAEVRKSRKGWQLYTISFVVLAAMVTIGVLAYGTQRDEPAPQAVRSSESSLSGAATTKPAGDTGNIWAALPKTMRGEHYTLNIHGKKATFTCPPPQYDAFTGQQLFGNSLFIPEYGEGIQIIMESGNPKGKWASTLPAYGVTDWCASAFDGDAGIVRLPPRQNGYYVVARTLAKPTNSPTMNVQGDLYMVLDEYGNNLLVLGLVTSNGFQTPSYTFMRTKGNSPAVDITGVFEWSGSVCYFNGTNYCVDEYGTNQCMSRDLCCTDLNADGIWDTCVDPVLDPVTGVYSCAAGTTSLTASCRDYSQEWVFNIADFVQYFWNTDNYGSKLVQVRFYPR